MATPASDVVQQASQESASVYDHAPAAAQHFMDNQGQLYPANDAVADVATQLGIDEPTAADTITHLAEDVVDPVEAIRTSEGTYYGVIGYTARDFYYEITQYHDTLGESTRAICQPCVNEATFDHQAVAVPDFHQYRKQAGVSAVETGHEVPLSATAQERRQTIGEHFLEKHTSLTPLQIGETITGNSANRVAHDLNVNPKVIGRAEINNRLRVEEVLAQYDISFDQVKQAFDLGIANIQVGASLVSGTTIATNTAIHGGNQGSFNVEDFGTAGAADTVPQSDGAGNLTMNTISGGSGIWSEDANSPLTISASSSGTITLSGQYPVVKVIIESDTSSTAGNHMDLRVNGDTASNYDTRLSGSTTSADSFVKAVFETGFGSGTEIIMSGEWSTNWSCGVSGGTSGGDTSAVHGSNTNVTSPLDSITFVDDAANNMSITASVYGLST